MKHPMPTAPKTKRLLLALNKGEKHTIYTAMNRLGIGALSQEAGRLRALGWKVASEWLTTRNGSRIKRYARGW